MTKQLTMLLLLMGCCWAACLGQGTIALDETTDDNSISVVSYFFKNDTMVYERTQSKMVVKGNDTIKNEVKGKTTYAIIVTDSTADGYVMEYWPIERDYWGRTDTTLSLNIDSVLQAISDTKVIFTTDELGQVTGVNNWREVRDTVRARMKPAFDNLYATIPEIEIVSPRSKLENILRLSVANESNVLSLFTDITEIFKLHGNMFQRGDTLITDDEKDHSTVRVIADYLPEEQGYLEGDYGIVALSVTPLSQEDVSSMLEALGGLMMSDTVANAMTGYIRDSVTNGVGAEVRLLEDYQYFFNGWPRLMRTQRITEFNGIKHVATDEIEYAAASWPYLDGFEADDDDDDDDDAGIDM